MKDKIIEILKTKVVRCDVETMAIVSLIHPEDIPAIATELEQLLSIEPEAMGEYRKVDASKRVPILENYGVVPNGVMKFFTLNKYGNNDVTRFDFNRNLFLDSLVTYWLESISHPKPVDEPKQLPNTTEGMSEEDIEKWLRENELSFISNLTSEVNIRNISDIVKIIKDFTSNNQQTEGRKCEELPLKETVEKWFWEKYKVDSDRFNLIEHCGSDVVRFITEYLMDNRIGNRICKACGHCLPIHYFDKEDVCYICEPLTEKDKKLIL